MTDTIRLNKYLAQCGVASRRGADELVFAGRVSINGKTADSPGIKVSQSDEVRLDGKNVSTAQLATDTTIMLHKPTQTVTTVKDPQGRPTVMDLLPEEIKQARPFPVGRLDFFSEGLLLLTTDGDLCHRLTHPKWHLPKVYQVTIRGKVPEEAIKIMESGMKLDEGEKLAPVKVRKLPQLAGTQMLELTLIQGVNRQIRRMCRDLNLTILTLKRVKQGPLSIGGLKSGKWRELTAKELQELKRAVGMR